MLVYGCLGPSGLLYAFCQRTHLGFELIGPLVLGADFGLAILVVEIEANFLLDLPVLVLTPNIPHTLLEVVFRVLEFLVGGVLVSTAEIELLAEEGPAGIFVGGVVPEGEVVGAAEFDLVGKGVGDSLLFEFHALLFKYFQ